MNIFIASLVVLLVATQALAEEMEFGDESDRPFSYQIQADQQDPSFARYLLRMARVAAPSPDVFYALLGKRNSGYKSDSFIGLMGKRFLDPESEERNIDQDFERRHK
ncbi:tachykinin-like peptide isoform X2 [Ascaphus truei]|uniref:tachykinin-like peptide isoform X2 n=1 Tax=Ascaphus truei TaxID=8439 RepID=UPI003F59B0C8